MHDGEKIFSSGLLPALEPPAFKMSVLTPIMAESQQPSVKFLTPEESADVDRALMSSSEKFLTRLTISSQKLLLYIANDLGISVEELTHQQIIEWIEKDCQIRREQGVEAAVLKW